jgi:hypothetical protein
MTAASRSLATALWKARFASGLLMKCYTTSWDTIERAGGPPPARRRGSMTAFGPDDPTFE